MQPPPEVAAGARRRPLVAHAPLAALVLAAHSHSQAPPRRIVRRVKMPQPNGDTVPPY